MLPTTIPGDTGKYKGNGQSNQLATIESNNMTITTKFNVGDKAFTIDTKTMKVREFEVGSMSIYVHDGKPLVGYRAKDDGYSGDSYDECFCFATENELLGWITAKDVKK